MKQMYVKGILPLMLGAALLAGCQKLGSDSGGSAALPGGKIAPDNFSFETSKKVSINLRLLDPANKPIKGVAVAVNTTGGNTVFNGTTDANGSIVGAASISAGVDTLVVQPNYIGVIQDAHFLVVDNTLNATLGGSKGYVGNLVEVKMMRSAQKLSVAKLSATDPVTGTKPVYSFLPGATYDSNGAPVAPTLLGTDPYDPVFNGFITNTLPESQKVPVNHPEFLDDAHATPTLLLDENATVFVTFVHEGASYKNVLGYYTYTGQAPATSAEIDSIHYLLPNASFAGSGGNLQTGNRVKVGKFSAGTKIGFVLIQDGWKGGTEGVRTTNQKFYTDPALNPETNAANKRHNVFFNYSGQYKYVVGFEDTNRETASANINGYPSDQDFNDLVFYVTADPETGVDETNIPPLIKPKDTDGDGVPDGQDTFPDDPERSSQTVGAWRTLAFEDQWPSAGDYDMNDLVVNYRYTVYKNSYNNITSIDAEYKVLAAGADFKNGFGVEFPFSSSVVASVTGQSLKSNYVSLNSNGTEAGQDKAVIIPFDNFQNLFTAGGLTRVNTVIGQPTYTSNTLKVNVKFTAGGITSDVYGAEPFNPFLISNLRRGVEVHLAGKLPTSKADQSLFGTADDASKQVGYYKSATNWPWALDFSTSFSYPAERAKINEAYLHFFDWTGSGGKNFTGWFDPKNSGSDYRNSTKIYK